MHSGAFDAVKGYYQREFDIKEKISDLLLFFELMGKDLSYCRNAAEALAFLLEFFFNGNRNCRVIKQRKLDSFGLLLGDGIKRTRCIFEKSFKIRLAFYQVHYITAYLDIENRPDRGKRKIYLLGSVFLAIPLSLYRHTAISVSAPSGILIFLLSLISYVAYKSINCGISAMGAANAAFLNLLEPVFGVLFSVMILKERLSFASFIGCTLTALSSLFLNFS